MTMKLCFFVAEEIQYGLMHREYVFGCVLVLETLDKTGKNEFKLAGKNVRHYLVQAKK